MGRVVFGQLVGPTVMALLALAVSMVAGLQQPAVGEARDDLTGRGPYVERTLRLDVPPRLKVGRPAAIRVVGSAVAGDSLSLFIDPNGAACPPSPAALPRRAIPLLEYVAVVDGPFGVVEAYTPGRRGQRAFCAYLGSEADRPELRASEHRTAIARRLRPRVARHTVVRALRRHGFAKRVVKVVKRDCDRERRDRFSCEFEARFPGYRLVGKGRVRLGADLSYRFRVRAQGIRFVLTDENED